MHTHTHRHIKWKMKPLLNVTGCTACSSVEEHVSPSLSPVLYLRDYTYSLTRVSYILGLFWKKCSQPSDIYKTWRIWLGDPSYSHSFTFDVQTWELIMSKSARSNIAEIFEQGIAHSSVLSTLWPQITAKCCLCLSPFSLLPLTLSVHLSLARSLSFPNRWFLWIQRIAFINWLPFFLPYRQVRIRVITLMFQMFVFYLKFWTSLFQTQHIWHIVWCKLSPCTLHYTGLYDHSVFCSCKPSIYCTFTLYKCRLFVAALWWYSMSCFGLGYFYYMVAVECCKLVICLFKCMCKK